MVDYAAMNNLHDPDCVCQMCRARDPQKAAELNARIAASSSQTGDSVLSEAELGAVFRQSLAEAAAEERANAARSFEESWSAAMFESSLRDGGHVDEREGD